MEIKSLYQTYLRHPQICTDTRKITEGCLFFCLKGENFDGNAFARQAAEAEAAAQEAAEAAAQEAAVEAPAAEAEAN